MKKIVKTDHAPQAIGPYSQAVVDTKTGLAFISEQIAIDPSTGELVDGDIVKQAHQVFANLKNILKAAKCEFDDVLKVTLFLKDMKHFLKVNEIYSEYFKKGYPARSAVEVARLPKDALVGIDMIAHV